MHHAEDVAAEYSVGRASWGPRNLYSPGPKANVPEKNSVFVDPERQKS